MTEIAATGQEFRIAVILQVSECAQMAEVPGHIRDPGLLIVGVAGFEPTTSSSRTKHATKLRHTPVTTMDTLAPHPENRETGSGGLRNPFL